MKSQEPQAQISINYRIGKLVDNKVEWKTPFRKNLITDYGMSAMSKFPTASLHRFVLLGEGNSYPKLDLEVTQAGTTVTKISGPDFTAANVGDSVIYPNGSVFVITGFTTPTTVEVDTSFDGYAGTAIVGHPSQITLETPFAASSTIDPTGTTNEHDFDETTDIVSIFNSRCVVFPAMTVQKTLREIGWTNDLFDSGINAYVVGRHVIDPGSEVVFNVGDIPYVQVVIAKTIYCGQRVLTAITGYSSGGTSQCLLHLPNFDDRYYSTIGPGGETVMPQFNSLLEPCLVETEQLPKFVGYNHDVDYENNPQSLSGFANQKSIPLANIDSAIALPEDRYLVAAEDVMYLYKKGTEITEISQLGGVSTVGMNMLSLGDGNIVAASPTLLTVFDVSSDAIVQVSSVTHSNIINMTVTSDDRIVVIDGVDMYVYQWSGSSIDAVSNELTVDWEYVSPNIGDKILAGGLGRIAIIKLAGTAINTIVPNAITYTGSLYEITRLSTTDYFVGTTTESFIIRLSGNRVVRINDVGVASVSGKPLTSLGAGHYYAPVDEHIYKYENDVLTAINKFSGYYLLSYCNKRIVAIDSIGSHYYTMYSNHNIVYDGIMNYRYVDSVILLFTKIHIVKKLGGNRVFIGADGIWTLFDLSNDTWQELCQTSAPAAVVDAVEANIPDHYVAATATHLYVINYTTGDITLELEIGVDTISLGVIDTNYLVVGSSTAHMKMFKWDSPISIVLKDTLIKPGRIATVNNHAIHVSGSVATIYKQTAEVFEEVNTYDVNRTIGQLEAMVEGPQAENNVKVVLTTDQDTRLLTYDLSEDNFRISVVSTVITSAYSIVTNAGHILAYDDDRLVSFNVAGDAIGIWGSVGRPSHNQPMANAVLDYGIVVQYNGRLTYYTISDNVKYGRDVATSMIHHSDDAPVKSLAFTHGDPSVVENLEWVINLDTPITTANAGMLNISNVNLVQQWIRG